jgi:hypothetical protein
MYSSSFTANKHTTGRCAQDNTDILSHSDSLPCEFATSLVPSFFSSMTMDPPDAADAAEEAVNPDSKVGTLLEVLACALFHAWAICRNLKEVGLDSCSSSANMRSQSKTLG